MKKCINTIFLKGFILLQTILLVSCNALHEDRSDCDLFLKFCYDYNLSYEDWFSSQVKQIKVFIFDTDGKFVEVFTQTEPEISTPNYRMKIPYQYKGYSAIVWAGKTEVDYQISQLNAGDNMESLLLHYRPHNDQSSHQIESLWHSGPHQMLFAESGGTEQTINLIRNTNDFHILVQSNNTAMPTTDFDIAIKGANGSYDHRNEFPQGISTITYRPAGDNRQSTADIYAMRVVNGESLTLSATHKVSGKAILFEGASEINLVTLLLKSKEQSMGDQEYLDRKYIWDIVLTYKEDNYMAINVKINNWTYWFQNTDL